MHKQLKLMRELSVASPSKIVLLVIDGLGGLADSSGKTELETAITPKMDCLAAKGNCGLVQTVSEGITPGSAPGHLGLFGYSPLEYVIGRGVLEALGIDIDLQPGDVAARGNFCTVDASGLITDRRAGRITSEQGQELCARLSGIEIDGTNVLVQAVKEHRFVLVFRGKELTDQIDDTDPQRTGVAPLSAKAQAESGKHTANIVNAFISEAKQRLAGLKPANMFLLRGFSALPAFPSFEEIYKMRSAAIACYPMYRGLAKVVGMDVLPTGQTFSDELSTLEQNYTSYDFFFLHVKGADAAGEDGDFARKVTVIEDIDKQLPRLLDINPDVLIITGDHSTPAVLSGHSWHPVPCLLSSSNCRPDNITKFSETTCRSGGLGFLNATSLMWLAMAHGLKLNKFGA